MKLNELSPPGGARKTRKRLGRTLPGTVVDQDGATAETLVHR